MILILLGTQKNSFKRLVQEVQKCIDNGIIKEEVILQAGSTEFSSKDMKIFDLISQNYIDKYIEEARFIITHGGVGSILTCIKKGKKVIAVPRQKQYLEHVNDHQKQIVEKFDKEGYIKGIFNLEDLSSTIKQIDEFTPKKYESNTKNMIKLITDYIDKH